MIVRVEVERLFAALCCTFILNIYRDIIVAFKTWHGKLEMEEQRLCKVRKNFAERRGTLDLRQAAVVGLALLALGVYLL